MARPMKAKWGIVSGDLFTHPTDSTCLLFKSVGSIMRSKRRVPHLALLFALTVCTSVTYAQAEEIPTWIKEVAALWASGEIKDSEFIAALEFLIENDVINVGDECTVASFVDPEKDPQHYIDRYNNESEYRAWFDTNFSDLTITEAVCANGQIKKDLPDANDESKKDISPNVDDKSKPIPTGSMCGDGTKYVDGECVILDPGQNSIPKQGSKTPPKSSNVYTNVDFQQIKTDPDKFEGQPVRFGAEINNKRDNTYTASLDAAFLDFNKVFFIESNVDLVENNCYFIDGVVLGHFTVENILTGNEIDSTVGIALKGYTPTDCFDIAFPIIKSVETEEKKSAYGSTITLKHVKFTEEHTRFFIEIDNRMGDREITLADYNSVLIQNSRQFETSYVFGHDYNDVNNPIPVGIIEDGYMIFDPISHEDEYNLTLEIRGSGFESTNIEFRG